MLGENLLSRHNNSAKRIEIGRDAVGAWIKSGCSWIKNVASDDRGELNLESGKINRLSRAIHDIVMSRNSSSMDRLLVQLRTLAPSMGIIYRDLTRIDIKTYINS